MSSQIHQNSSKENKKYLRREIYKLPQKGLFHPISDKDKFITNASPNKLTSEHYYNRENNELEKERILNSKINKSSLLNNKITMQKSNSGKIIYLIFLVNQHEAEFKILSARLSRKNTSSSKPSKEKQNPLFKNTSQNNSNYKKGLSKESSNNNIGNMKNTTKSFKTNIPINFSNASMKIKETQKNKKPIDCYMNINNKPKNNDNKLEIKGIKINNFQNAINHQFNSNGLLINKQKLKFQSKSDRILKSTSINNELFLLK